DERLHLELAELRAAGAGEAAAEAFHAGDADAAARELEHDVLTLEHRHADALEVRADRVLRVLVVVVIAEHGDGRHADVRDLLRHQPAFLARAVLRQVARDQQHVRVLLDRGEAAAQLAAHVEPDVHVADRGDADYPTVSGVPGSVYFAIHSSSTSSTSGGSTSRATSHAARLRSSDDTSPIRWALPPATLTITSSTLVRGSVANASRMRPTKCFASIAVFLRSTLVDLAIQLAHDVIRHVLVERVRVEEQAQHAPRRLPRAAQHVFPVELGDADHAERIVPVPRPALVVHGCL